MHIWTDRPITEIWHQLRYLASPANLQHVLTGEITSARTENLTPEAAAPRARQIASCLKQADEYFHAAQAVGLATRPLLQFYGAQALSKAVILANDASLDLTQLKYHGLTTRPNKAPEPDRTELQAYSENPSDWILEREFAIAHGGVFPHLARAAADRILNQGCVLRFKDLIRVVPDLADMYARHYGEPSHCLYLYSGPEIAASGRCAVYFSVPDHRTILDVFPEFSSGYNEVELHDSPGYESVETASESPGFASVERGTIAGQYLVRAHSSGIHKPLTVLYAAMFILSNVVRYKPAFWMDVIEGRATGSASMAEALCNHFDRRFPNEILDHIWHEHFTFGTPGYVS
jgi:hypothetical protein